MNSIKCYIKFKSNQRGRNCIIEFLQIVVWRSIKRVGEQNIEKLRERNLYKDILLVRMFGL